MIQVKKKICIGCQRETYIFSRGYCKYCASKRSTKEPKKRKPIRQFSKKKLDELKIYRKLRDDYLKKHPNCERCGGKATDLHHKKPRQYHLNDVGVFCALCRDCHMLVHDNDRQSREQGFLLTKH